MYIMYVDTPIHIDGVRFVCLELFFIVLGKASLFQLRVIHFYSICHGQCHVHNH